MGSIGRYIFRTTFGAFVLVLVSLSAIIWITQALRDLNLMTNQAQTFWVFIQITALIIPQLVIVIAPIALVIAVAYILNKLAADSEIIVINASGMSPWRMFRPFLAVALVVSVLVAILTAWGSPESLRSFRRWLTEIRADLVTYIVRPGRFVTVQNGITFHIRERGLQGQLLGVLIDDKRNPKEHLSILAEQGEILKNERGTFLILQGGTVQRHEVGQLEPHMVEFDRYAFDLSQFATPVTINYSVRERYFWELLSPDRRDPLVEAQPWKFRAELHDRILAPFYPLAFTFIAYALLGAPRTTRESRGLSLVATIVAVGLLRFIGFACTVLAAHLPAALAVQYAALAAAIGLSAWTIARGIIVEPPAFLTSIVATLAERFSPRTAAA
jgi:lipopolysaccharide export system permease protein